jgi:hypothetical protein
MKKLFFTVAMTCLFLVSAGAKQVYFTETFNRFFNSGNLDVASSKLDSILYWMYSPMAVASSDTAATFGYYPAGGFSKKPDYTNPNVYLAFKWVKLNGNSENYVTYDWFYNASAAPSEDVGACIAARIHPDSAWVTIASVSGSRMGFDNNTSATGTKTVLGKVPSELIAGQDSVQVAVLFKYSTNTSVQFLFYFDNVSFISFGDEGGRVSASLQINSPGAAIKNIENYDIAAKITNESGVIVDSVVLGYTHNGGAVQYKKQTFSPSLQVLGATSFVFNPEELTNSSKGANDFEVWIAKLNDSVFAQGELGTVEFSVYIPDAADALYPTKYLVEHFTSSTCGPCAGNNTTMNPYYEQQDAAGKLIYIKYQMNWPGDGDPYYVEEDGGVRRDYYQVNAVPTMFGNSEVYSSKSALNTKLNAFNGTKSFLDVSFNQADISPAKNIRLEYTITPKLTAELTIHTVVFEDVTYNNKRTNGETEFHHVVMKMFPNGDGNVFQLKKDSVHKFAYTHDMSSTHIERIHDLQVVVFVQNDKTGEIYVAAQNKIDTEGLAEGNEKFVNAINVNIYPNPATDEVTVESPANSALFLYNSIGALVYEGITQGNKKLPIASMPSGIYILKVVSEKGVATERIIKR